MTMTLDTDEYFQHDGIKFAVYCSYPEANNIEHKHTFDELVFVKKGHGLHVINDSPHFIKAGDVFFVDRSDAHFYDELGSLEIINILINPKAEYRFIHHIEPLLKRLKPGETGSHYWMEHVDDRELKRIFSARYAHSDEVLQAARQESFLLQLITQLLEDNIPGQTLPSARIHRLLLHLQEIRDQEIHWDVMAEQFHLPKRTLYRYVKEMTGMTPELYLRRLRLMSARKRLTHGSESITEVALACGFHSSSQFATAYKQVFGLTPSQTRGSDCQQDTSADPSTINAP